MLFVSWFALFLFYKNEFDSENPNKAVNVIAIIIKLSAFGGLSISEQLFLILQMKRNL